MTPIDEYGPDNIKLVHPIQWNASDDDLLFFTKANDPILFCLKARTGEALADGVRLPGLREVYASPVGAAGRIYIVGRDGTTLVIKDQPELEVLATNRLDDPIDASPAAVGKDLFLRSKRRLYCISRTAQATGS